MTEYCPRAVLDNGGGPDSPFEAPYNGEMTWSDEGRCSYCGSMSEEAFFKAIEDGVAITPTDKNYKVYVDVPFATGIGKFYFQHLSEEGRQKFISLHNDRKMVFKEPGYLYTMPYFCKLRDSE